MEKINIKFDEKQLEEVVKKITEKLKEEKEPGTINGKENERIWKIKRHKCQWQEK